MWKAIGRAGLFIEVFAKAAFFAVKDYDLQLQRTRTPKQRYMIWVMVAFLTLIGLITVLYALRLFTAGIVDKAPTIQ